MRGLTAAERYVLARIASPAHHQLGEDEDRGPHETLLACGRVATADLVLEDGTEVLRYSATQLGLLALRVCVITPGA